MKRDLNKLSNTEYDVVILGSGIYGLNTAWDAVLRGLKVALIDKGDFMNATSSNSMKVIHGGLRYLQHLDFRRMRESIHERT
ncbi:MAG: glycerol-3-phosphate dehydrogenase/oxidase, partial [Nitrospirae bacterium CG08_land_8_20_14_0_20_52_24]